MEQVVKTLELVSQDNFKFIRDYMKENEITYTQLGKGLGTSRQNAFKLVHSDNLTSKVLLNVCKTLHNINSGIT